MSLGCSSFSLSIHVLASARTVSFRLSKPKPIVDNMIQKSGSLCTTGPLCTARRHKDYLLPFGRDEDRLGLDRVQCPGPKFHLEAQTKIQT